MKVTTITCPGCKETIYSRARHDMKSCSCNGVFIDGGTEYTRIGGTLVELANIKQAEITATKQELYDDWNTRGSRYGVIPDIK